jgi:mono/diheme cytochrome c family protein
MKAGWLGLAFVSALVVAGCPDYSNQPGLTADPEQAALNAYPDIPAGEQAMQDAERGAKLFKQATCISCHSTEGDRRNLAGPPLGGVSDRVLARHDNDALKARRWLVKHIKDAPSYPGEFAGHPDYPNFMTPNPRLTDEDLRALVEYLWTLR